MTKWSGHCANVVAERGFRSTEQHEEEFLQSDDEIAMKVMINEASSSLSVVTTGKATTEGFGSQETSECSDKPSLALVSWFYMDRHKKEGGQAWSDHRLHPERVLREQEAHRGFIQNMTTGALHVNTGHILVSADSRVISMRVHKTALRHLVVFTPNVESVVIDGGRIAELTKVQPDWREGLRDLEQSRITNFNEALHEVRNLLQRDDEPRSQGEDGHEARPAQRLQSQLCDG